MQVMEEMVYRPMLVAVAGGGAGAGIGGNGGVGGNANTIIDTDNGKEWKGIGDISQIESSGEDGGDGEDCGNVNISGITLYAYGGAGANAGDNKNGSCGGGGGGYPGAGIGGGGAGGGGGDHANSSGGFCSGSFESGGKSGYNGEGSKLGSAWIGGRWRILYKRTIIFSNTSLV